MEFKETNNTSYKKIKEIFKEYDCLALIPILWIGAFISLLIVYIFYAIYIIFNGIIKSILAIFFIFLGIIKLFFSDDVWTEFLAYLQFTVNEEEYEIFEENTEDEHEDKHEDEKEQEDEQESE